MNRVSILAEKVDAMIKSVQTKGRCIRCLDIGCGDMTLAETIALMNPDTAWSCMDIHELPSDCIGKGRWAKYRQFDGRHIPYADRSFHVALLCDVLHHVSPSDVETVLREASRVAGMVVIKDHFESGIYSRTMLRLMDWMGNWGYGVSIPDRYFTKTSFAKTIKRSGLEMIRQEEGVSLYNHLPVMGSILRKEWQFIAVLGPALQR